MTSEMNILIVTAVSIGFFHTLFGPDHYLPFVVISWARKWSALKTAVITVLCGLGHVLSSVVLGFIGISMGLAVNRLELFESSRGSVAAWLLIGFGLAYTVWGICRAYRNKPHSHSHFHAGDNVHSHEHDHHDGHVHVHDSKENVNITPWALFVIFVFGPCEPLIPILMYPAAQKSMSGLIIVATVFSVVTISTMVSIVLLGRAGVSFVRFNVLERFTHAIAGATILACGLAIQFLGL